MKQYLIKMTAIQTTPKRLTSIYQREMQIEPLNQSNTLLDIYLPLPTHMDMVQDVLYQCKEIAEGLNLSETDLVLDHAIYSKAV